MSAAPRTTVAGRERGATPTWDFDEEPTDMIGTIEGRDLETHDEPLDRAPRWQIAFSCSRLGEPFVCIDVDPVRYGCPIEPGGLPPRRLLRAIADENTLLRDAILGGRAVWIHDDGRATMIELFGSHAILL